MEAAPPQLPPLAASQEPMVRSPGENLDLRHPTPDLQSLQGAYVGNIERLETKAERMSSSGSELGEEIRRLHREQKLADSRRSSLKSPVTMDAVQPPTVRSRNTSTSSYAHSIVDLNTTARWGGYSPGGYVTSPIGSLASGSLGLKRQTSVTRSSRLDQVIQPEDDHDMSGAPAVQNPVPMLNSPKPPTHRSRRDSIEDQQQPREQRQSQLGAGMLVHDDNGDYLAALQHEGGLGEMPAEIGELSNPEHAHLYRPGTAGSGDTYQQARALFHDFDGVHYSPPTQEDILRAGRVSFLPPTLHPPQEAFPQAYPPPRDHMVFYPAPVPKMLNLPKRLSQMPSSAVQAKRKTQMLETLPPDARKSAVWLTPEAQGSSSDLNGSAPQAESSDAPKKRPNADKKKSMAHIPPQLRASMYFDQKGPSQEVKVMGDSAVDTLDSILDASALAPVNAFIDHPFAGHAGSAIYAKEVVPQRRSTANLLETKSQDARKSRASLLFGKKESSGDQPNKLQKRASQLSLAAQLEAAREAEEALHDSHHDDDRLSGDERGSIGDEDDETPEEEQPIHLSEPQFSGPPTTLLAELQMRKQQQKTRNRAAATAFPNGMHATLLELDAVAQIEKERRKGQRVALAWEDPAIKAREDEEEEEDDDVPLAMLFPAQNGLINKADPLARDHRDWDRPLGLIEKRELEDNEPLSKRRNRLKGYDPNRRPSPNKLNNGVAPPPSEIAMDVDAEENEEEEEETLAQRIRRLKTRKELDTALEDVEARPVSNLFSSELLSQFGGLDVEGEKEKEKGATPPEKTVTPGSEEEETLGQRRARLQREAMERTQTLQLPLATGMNANRLSTAWSQMAPGQMQQQMPQQLPQQPVLKQSRSMADLLAAHPVGAQHNQARKISNEAFVDSLPTGSLLQQSEMTQQRLKRGLMETNKRSSTFGLDLPLVHVGHAAPDKDKDWDTPLGLLGQANAKGPRLGLMQQQPAVQQPLMAQNPMAQMGVWSLQQQQQQQLGGMQMPMQMGMPQMGMPPMGMPQMGMGMGMGMMPGLYQQPGIAMSGFNMGAMGAMGMPVTYAAAAQMGAAGEVMMDQRQRDLIDRWRQSIM